MRRSRTDMRAMKNMAATAESAEMAAERATIVEAERSVTVEAKGAETVEAEAAKTAEGGEVMSA